MKTNSRTAHPWGFTATAEVWNGRLAMLGILAAMITELLSRQGVMHFWGLR
ncbi:MAG: hypothetical protein BJG00_002185 [Limnothrix sp. CACIAM 69d]|uniref:chlorophyll a/b-binding protein n=1 Tax=unclassified Limnothrix TaxID=2632864 RepID=UPI000A61836B|nr:MULTISPECIES: chlorophyll a/b-binding protein [unclassified Limnothrix]RFP62899.1 MAG: hypothetical protein BJG00_002185 [Limnothrix sp. CACIAM 69d]MBD2160726.1 hypothetical protein [Limnothrix sp. FACHB-1083]MBD2191431.1 hypothetical protein [Limnothrix sp. FACHB-1088]MBD2553991.1 hypothetical protein [Limnothrix sp. FACHB-708]MBD2592490.1 hypothetical protein [Limnothrix sp. FACHB-406]